MQAMKHSLIALAVAAVSSQLALAEAETNQADAKGFIDGYSAQVLLRNTYWNRDWKSKAAITDNSAWAQGFIGTFNSGFTQGPVGFGLDAFGLLGVRLDGGTGKAGGRSMGGLLAAHGRNHNQYRNGNNAGAWQSPRDEWGQIGGAVKARFSGTVLKYGHQMPELPVLAIDDSRLLPESFTGYLLTSKEIEGLQIDLGRFTQDSAMAWASRDPVRLKNINIGGVRYTTADEGTSLAFYASKLKSDYYGNNNYGYKRYYTGAYHSIGFSEQQSLDLDFNFYHTKYNKEASQELVSKNSAKNTIWSLQGTYNIGGHGLILAYQQSSGDTGYDYDYGDGGGSIWLANSFFSDFNGEREKSLQLGYSLDFAEYGIEGLSWRMAYVVGDQKGRKKNYLEKFGGKGHERDFYNQVKYTVQEGSLKDLAFKVRNGIYRSSNNSHNGQSDLNEWRLFVEYPLDLTF